MTWRKTARLALLTAVAVGSIWLGRPGTANAVAAEAQPSAGQLGIVGKDGKVAGLCPLAHTDVQADVAGYVARVTVTQEFVNSSKEPFEAVYTFPLPGDAAVDDMTMTIGDRRIRGEIKRREEARAIYEAARNAGQAAALLDQERPNIFTQSVANVMPGEKIKIAISYVNVLKYREGRYEFVFPMVVGPRFTGSGIVTDANKITPPITPKDTRAGHDIALSVRIDAGLPLQDVKSALHDVTVRRRGATGALVTLNKRDSIPNKDFILTYGAAGSELQSGILTYAPGGGRVASATTSTGDRGGYFTLIVQPPVTPRDEDISPREMVFVIDQTGSQQGQPIARAKELMRHAIKRLRPGDTFQILGFNTAVYPCFDAPTPVSDAAIEKALKFLEPIEGNGGTDILKAVDYVLKLPEDPERLRMVCYLTDGYVGNDAQIIDFITKNIGRTRMFPVGVGNGVNRFLIDGMARAGRGAADYLTLNADEGAAADRFYKRVESPVLLDVSVDWNGLPVEDVLPRGIPDVFSAGPVILRGRYTKAAEGDVIVKGILRGRPWSQKVHVSLPARTEGGSAIATLWARERIEDLQNQDLLGMQSGTSKPEIQQQIVNIALEYRLMSQHTSFVAVEERVVNVGGKQRRIDVPVEMPDGVSYEGIFGETQATGRATTLFAGTRAYSVGGGAYGPMGPAGPVGLASAPMPAPMTPTPAEAKRARPETHNGAPRDAEGNYLADSQAMTPEQRKAALRAEKLAKPLSDLVAYLAKNPARDLNRPGLPSVAKGKVEVVVRVSDLPTDGLAKLKAAGLEIDVTLQPGHILLGVVAVDKLDALIALDFVRRVETPQYR